MKRILLILPILITSLTAEELLNPTQQNLFSKKQQKAEVEGKIVKDSWINPLNLEAKANRSKSANGDEVDSQSLSIGFSQEIFKSGAIKNTIKKGKLESKLNTTKVEQEKNELIFKLYSNVLDLKKIDLKLQQTFFLIKNKEIEIEKNRASYVNGLIDITVLDESVIELSDLKNQIDDYSLQRADLLRDFKNYSDVNYQDIDISFIKETSLENFLSQNYNITVQDLELKKASLEKSIIKSNYLPKLTFNGSYGLEDGDRYTKSDDAYNYGLTLSLPLDFNSPKEQELAKLNKLIAKDNYQQTKTNEENFFKYSLQRLKFIDKKIQTANETLARYENLYKSTKELFQTTLKTIEDVEIMKNRVNSSRLDTMIFDLDKKLLLVEIYKRVL